MLRIRGLTVVYGDTVAVDRVDLDAADGEVVCVLGPSGCGKSSILRAVAGLEPAAAGTVAIDGEDVTAARPDRRRVGLMFQDHALFPHRTVADNVGFGPRMRGAAPAEVAVRVAEVLDLVDLAETADRRVTELSGGEQQRVALARAIAPRPRLLMLDEPLGSLDRVLRDRLLADLPGVFAEIGTTVVYVTHDQEEALALADRVAVMAAGEILQAGDPESVWRAPRSAFVARFLGLGPIVRAQVRGGVAHGPLGAHPLPGVPDGPATLVPRPGAVRLAEPDAAGAVGATVTGRRFAGDHAVLGLRLPAGIELTVRGPALDGPRPGDAVAVVVDRDGLHRLDADPGS